MRFKELFKRTGPMLDISDSRNLKPDWEYIKTIPEFAAMVGCPQNREYHKEGDVWTHTKLVADAMFDLINGEDYLHFYRDLLPEQQTDMSVMNYILMCAAICHDLGKAGHTSWDENDKEWHCENHGKHGDLVVRKLFHEENPIIREAVANLVRNHMALHYINEKRNDDKRKRILTNLSWSNSSLLMYLMLLISDCVGAYSKENHPSKIYQRIKKIIETGNTNEISFSEISNPDLKLSDKDVSGDKKLYILIGIAGAGKDTFIKNHFKDKEYVEISRDKIRAELGVNPRYIPQQKIEKKVTGIFDKRFREALESGEKNIIINNTNLVRKYREPFVKDAIAKGYKIVFCVIEAPSISDYIERRKDNMEASADKVINDMVEKFEFPDFRECHELYVYKQNKRFNGTIDETVIKFEPGKYNFTNIKEREL